MEDIRDKILKRQDIRDNEIFKYAKVSVLGCGGLGSTVSMILARSGVTELNLYDFDYIEYSNLNRQNYRLDEVGKKKTLTTKKRIEETLPYVKVNTKDIYIDKDNIKEIIDDADFFIEAFDNRESKTMLFDYFTNIKDKYLFTASGMAGLGDISDIKIKKFKNITMLGDFKSNAKKDGLYLAYVGIVASLEVLECLKKIREVKNGW